MNKYIPCLNDAMGRQLTLADWEALAFPALAIDALSLLIWPRLSIPKNVEVLYWDTSIRPEHKVSKKHDYLYSPLDGSKIAISPEILENIRTNVGANNIRLGECYSPLQSNQLIRDEKTIINIQDAQWKDAVEPISPTCSCYTCQQFTLAYLHHLYHAGVPLGARLCIVHNLAISYAMSNNNFLDNFLGE